MTCTDPIPGPRTAERLPRGFAIGATGPLHMALARQVVVSLRAQHPDIPIDLYSDTTVDWPELSCSHVLPEGTTRARPRFHILRESRFDKTIALDTDMWVLAPVDDVFDLLNRFDLAMVQDQWRNSGPALLGWTEIIPNAFPQVNCGLFAMRRSPETLAFVDRWETAYQTHDAGVDQPTFRQLVWNNKALHIATLPPEYNLWDYRQIDRMTPSHAAPRVLHSHLFKRPRLVAEGQRDPHAVLPLMLGRARMLRLGLLLDGDRTLQMRQAAAEERSLDFDPLAPETPGLRFARAERMRIMAAHLRDLPRYVRQVIGRLTGRVYP